MLLEERQSADPRCSSGGCDGAVADMCSACALRSSLPDHDNDSIDMVLMRRFKDCVNAAPVSVAALAADPASSAPSTASASGTASSSEPAPVVDEYTFARLSLTTDISSILHREIRELFALREASIDAQDSFTLAYVDQAEQTLLRRVAEWQAAHPFWTMRRPSYHQLKEEETRKYKRRQEERAKQAERSRSILGQENAWPDLPKGPAPKPAAAAVVPAQSKRSATASPQVGASPAASSPALDAATAPAQPSPLLRAASASSTAAAGPSASPPLTSSSATAATPSASPAPAVSGARSSFFNDDEHGIEDRYHREKAERAKQAAATAAATAASATSSGTETVANGSSSSTAAVVPPKPGRSAQSQAQSQQQSAPDVYYFYQCSDGQQLYLHGLTYRSLLLQHGGNVSALPARIKGRIAHLDHYVVDRDVRGKHRFLAHLPLTASFGLALVELTSPLLSRATVATMASEFAADKKARQAAARRQKDLNKRTIQSSKAMREAEGGAAASSGGGGSFLPEWQQDAASFPGLAANPLGFASGAPADASSSSATSTSAPASGSASSLSGGSPQTRVANWNVVAEKGMASSELWAPLQSASSPVIQSVSHWGSAAAPMAKAAGGSHPPSLSLGSAGWGRKPAAASSSSSSSHPDDADAESFPLPTVNRHGQTTLLSTAGRRSYK